MRMKHSRKRRIAFRNRNVSKDREGVPVISYDEPVELTGETWPAGGKLQIETYGNRVNSIHNVRLQGKYRIEVSGGIQQYAFDGIILQEGDGVHLFTEKDSEPDYKIICIKPYKMLYLEVEKM